MERHRLQGADSISDSVRQELAEVAAGLNHPALALRMDVQAVARHGERGLKRGQISQDDPLLQDRQVVEHLPIHAPIKVQLEGQVRPKRAELLQNLLSSLQGGTGPLKCPERARILKSCKRFQKAL